MTPDQVKSYIRAVPDFPRPGILFRDITPLLATPGAFGAVVNLLGERVARHRVESLVAIESRGFLFGAALAMSAGLPLEVVRKPGKLPYQTVAVEYALEYGVDRVELHVDAVRPGRRYAVIDDLIATGGTAAATARLIERQGGTVAVCAFVIELAALGGRAALGERPVESLIVY